MNEVVKLTVVEKVKVPPASQQVLERFDADIKRMRERLENSEAGGYVIMAYDQKVVDGRPEVHSMLSYFAHNPTDGFWLPDMVKTRTYQRIHDE